MLNRIKQSKLLQLLTGLVIGHLITWVSTWLRHHNSGYKSPFMKDLFELNCVVLPVMIAPYLLYYLFVYRKNVS